MENQLLPSGDNILQRYPNAIALLDSLQIGIVFQDTEGRISSANPAAQQILGLSAQEIAGTTSTDPRWQAIHADGSPFPGPDHPAMAALRSQNAVLDVEMGIFNPRTADIRWISVNSFPMFDEVAGALLGVYSVFEDISARKSAQTQIDGSLSLLYATVNACADALLVVDLNNTWVLFNKQFIDLWNIPDEFIASKDDRAALAYVLQQLEEPRLFLDKVHALYASQDADSFDTFKFKNGKIIERYSTPQFIDNTVVGRVWSFRDVTERKLAEQALLRENEKNRALLRNASDGIHILDSDGNIVEVSDSFCAMLGYLRQEMIGMHVSQWDANFVGEALKEVVSRQFRDKVRAQFETRHRRKDGSLFDVEISGFPLELDGKPVLFNSSRDISERKRLDIMFRQKERYQRALLDNFPFAVWLKDTESCFLTVNTGFARIFGVNNPDELIGKNDFDIAPQDLAEAYRADDQEVQRARRNKNVEEIIVTQGESRWFETYKAPVVDDGGELLGSVGFARDITENKQARENLRLAASVFTHAREGIMITQPDGAILDVNKAFSHITGYGREEVLGQNPRLLSSGRQGREFYAALWSDLIEYGYWQGEIWNRRKDGEVYIELLTISSVKNAQGDLSHYLGLFTDISAIKEQQQQLEHIAHYDALTNLPNRVLLADRLQQGMAQSLRRAKTLAVLYLDLDGFKQINDKHGHDTGDQVLVSVTAHMKEVLREGDTLARFGGDEFVAVLVDLGSLEECVPMLARLLAAASMPLEIIAREQLSVSASIGVTFYPQPEEIDADQLFRQADQAMYQAKLLGKNRYHVFDPKQDSDLGGHHESLNQIRLALQNDEFVLYYQPKVNMRSGDIIGAEALIRWLHPQRGLLAPAFFLPVIEDHPFAVEIGEWVIGAALSQIERWQDMGLAMRVSVNIGARQLQQADFMQRLQGILARHPEAPPGCLELEVLETSALGDIAHVSGIIEHCRALGVTFALDDFGTGYSSLTYLKRLAVTLLKIDQSFVRDMLDDPDDIAILHGILGLASAFRREVIAEGVETVRHGELLLQLGCELAQGYGIARPMPADDLPVWVANWRTHSSWAES